MIIDNIKNCKNYFALHPKFAEAFKFLQALDETQRGTIELDGKNLYVMINEVEPVGKPEAKFEVHQQYIDIQYIVSGSDNIGWSEANDKVCSTDYDEENDFQLLKAEACNWFKLTPGYFAIFYPEDAHAPLAGNESMVKAVVKVKIS